MSQRNRISGSGVMLGGEIDIGFLKEIRCLVDRVILGSEIEIGCLKDIRFLGKITMLRKKTPFLPNEYYHLYNRGNNRQLVFFERDNYIYFLKGIKKYIREYVDILAYCLMPTHYHILVKVKPKTSDFFKQSDVLEVDSIQQKSDVFKKSDFLETKMVSLAMQRLGISYTKAINKRFDRVGALFQGPFQSKPVEDYNHLIQLCYYIHINPVKDGLVALPEEWEFSNYPEWLNLRAGTLVNREFIQDHFGTAEEYKVLVMNHLKTRNLSDEVKKYLPYLEK